MLALRFALVALSLLILAAHFLRGMFLPVVGVCLLGLVLMWIPRRWAIAPVQGLLLVGTLEWVGAALRNYHIRVAQERPWQRMVIILGTVALLTLVSALLPFFGRMRAYYRRGADARARRKAEQRAASSAADQSAGSS